MDVVLLSGHWGLPHLAMFISDEIFWAVLSSGLSSFEYALSGST